MANLKCDMIDLNSFELTNKLREVIQGLISKCTLKFQLQFKEKYYFEIVDYKEISRERGWYIIFHDKSPIYVGETKDFNYRLNTSGGTTDNYGNKNRGSDDERNFIKKFNESGILKTLHVWLITEKDLLSELNLKMDFLSDLDRKSVEKFINIFRDKFDYK